MNTTEATQHYRGIFEKRTPEELRTLAHIKRFMERLVADPGFRQALADNVDDPKGVAERYGIDVDPQQMLPLYHRQYLRFRFTEEEARWPLALAWDEYMKDMFRHRDLLREEGSMEGIHPRFHAWRERQIRRSMSELGGSGPSITHPIVAFELSEGCTVGCWFCGLSADRFKGYFPYSEENADLWRKIVATIDGMFGTAARTGFCYWATDPCDNPDYDRFIADYYHITGALPQTTTAAPLKDPALTRRILALFEKYRTVTNRFSVLTVKHLEKIHAAFTPEELMGVELVMQNRESLTAKADAGRARERQAKLREAGKSDKIAELSRDHTTIACVSGFLVNLMKKTVQLVTPVPGSARWPLGYRIFGEREFSTGAEFREAIESLIDEHMIESLPSDWPARFRADLRYEPMVGGFKLHSRSTEHTIQNAICGEAAGALLARGDLAISDVIEQLVKSGVSVLVVADLLEKLFQCGLVEEPGTDESRPTLVDAEVTSLAV